MVKWRGRRATFLEWCTLVAIVAVGLAIVSQWIWQDWSTHGIPEWYESYLRWQHRHGFPEWFPL